MPRKRGDKRHGRFDRVPGGRTASAMMLDALGHLGIQGASGRHVHHWRRHLCSEPFSEQAFA
jgi:hypothetical protein